MAPDPSAEHVGGYVVCVGMSLRQVGEVALLMRGRAVVVATADTEGARALLGPADRPAAARREPVVQPSVLPEAARAVGWAQDQEVPMNEGRRSEPYATPAAGGMPPPPSSGQVPVVAAPGSGPVPVVPPRAGVTTLVRGPLAVDLAAREVRAAGRRIHLSMQEFDLLVALASDTDRVWSFAELTHHVWRTGYLGDPDPVVSAVKRLRKRLRAVPDLVVASVRGIGYRLLVPTR